MKTCERMRGAENKGAIWWKGRDMEQMQMWEGEVRRNEINNKRLHNRNLIRAAGPYIAPDLHTHHRRRFNLLPKPWKK